jgi:DNA polymerase-3 subunit epsilon
MTMPSVIPQQRHAKGLDFVALDVETANSARGSVCAIGLAVVRGGQVVEQHAWLNRPPTTLDWFDGFNTALHGISAEDVHGEPTFLDRVHHALEVICDLPVVAHNAAFDVGALRDGHDAEGLAWPTLTYACSLVIARRELDLVSYRLPMVAAELGVPLERHHHAGADALAAAQIVLALAARRGARCLDELVDASGVRYGHLLPDQWTGCKRRDGGGSGGLVVPSAAVDADPDHPLHGQVVVFTGALALRRQDAWERVAAVGATVEKGVTRRTTRLVVGDDFTGDDLAAFTTGKAAKAVALRAAGQPIEVLTEADLTVLLSETMTAGRRLSAVT